MTSTAEPVTDAEQSAPVTALLAPPVSAIVAPASTRASFDLDESERAMIEAALIEHHHNVTQAAQALGLSRGALYRRMARHGL